MVSLKVFNSVGKELRRIEQAYDVRVLYACESGSRAWGLPMIRVRTNDRLPLRRHRLQAVKSLRGLSRQVTMRFGLSDVLRSKHLK